MFTFLQESMSVDKSAAELAAGWNSIASCPLAQNPALNVICVESSMLLEVHSRDLVHCFAGRPQIRLSSMSLSLLTSNSVFAHRSYFQTR